MATNPHQGRVGGPVTLTWVYGSWLGGPVIPEGHITDRAVLSLKKKTAA